MPITLLQINVAAIKASNGAVARDIGTMALARGWNSYIAYGRISLPCDSKLIRIGSDLDIKIHGLLTRLFDIHGLGSRIATKRFLKTVDKIKPDIVHLHNIHGYYINYRLLFNYLVKNKIPIVWTFHDCWPYTGHCAHFELYNCDKWKTGCHHCSAIHGYPSSLLIDGSRRSYSLKKRLFTKSEIMHITTVSNWLKGLTEQSYFSKYPISVIYDGIDVNEFKYRESDLRESYNLKDKFVLIAAAANWTTAKGLNDFVKLSGIIPNDCVIFMIGVREEQKRLLPDNIIAIPRVNGKDNLAKYYSMADVLLNLSYQETFGMTTAEAMACGTPGISYNKTACPEILSPETGIVVEAGNMDQILSAIITIKNHGKSYYSQACRQRVLQYFDFSKVNKGFFDIYEQILCEKDK